MTRRRKDWWQRLKYSKQSRRHAKARSVSLPRPSAVVAVSRDEGVIITNEPEFMPRQAFKEMYLGGDRPMPYVDHRGSGKRAFPYGFARAYVAMPHITYDIGHVENANRDIVHLVTAPLEARQGPADDRHYVRDDRRYLHVDRPVGEQKTAK
jgi:hypothetical protein